MKFVSLRSKLRLSVFPYCVLWNSLIWGLSYSRENFSPFPCYFFSKIRWTSCVLVCGSGFLSVFLLVFVFRGKNKGRVCVLKRIALISVPWPVGPCWSWGLEEQDGSWLCCADPWDCSVTVTWVGQWDDREMRRVKSVEMVANYAND